MKTKLLIAYAVVFAPVIVGGLITWGLNSEQSGLSFIITALSILMLIPWKSFVAQHEKAIFETIGLDHKDLPK